ncbi:RNA-binding protein 34 isoform X3 [Gouania willdenowi]|uniref:RNA-binding protein 34 isoform X3 n=1 Tax=Gouania willdenowi TaxID=441366 RepID=UPI00105522C9|nr:RNA-binding protein 34 isoform X3 [Gouania willdenowi]
MKKKPSHSEDASLGQQSADYTVGQVSGSLLQNCPAASGSLFALFSTPAPAASLVFQAAPKQHVKKSTDTNDHPKLSPEANDEICVKKKNKKLKDKCAADHSLKNRESTFQDTDEDLKGEVQSTTKRKRTVSNTEEEKDATYWVMKRQKLRANREEETVKSKKTVFVGNLPISCSKKTLRSIFRDTGPIESIRFRSLVREDPSMSRKLATIRRQVHPKKQSINAYVVFKEEGGATKALQRNGLEVEKDFHIRVDRVTGSSSHDHKCSVFVGNLPFDITEVALRKHFEVIGAVEAVRLVRDQNTGMGKGFGYVLFKSADYVQLALELNGSKLAERSIRVMRSVKKEKNKKKMDSKGASKRAGKSPTKDSRKGSSSEAEARRGGFRSQRKFTGKQQFTKRPSSFKGEMVDPSKKTKKKGLKKKKKPTKCVHIVGANP